MEYRFLPGLQSTYTKEIRAHVLHHSKCNYLRSRRSKKKPSKKRVDDEAEVGQPSRSLKHPRIKEEPRTVGGALIQVNDERAKRQLSQTLFMPAASDPLNSAKLPKFRDRHFLVHNYIHTLVNTYYQTQGRSRWNPNGYLFNEGLGDEAYCLIALTVSARHHEQLVGSSNVNSLKYETEALQTLNRRVEDERNSVRIETIVTILGFIALDMEFPRQFEGRQSASRLAAHICGLRDLIQRKGGVLVLSASPFFDWIFHWLDLCASGELSAGMTPLSAHAFCSPSSPLTTKCSDDGLPSYTPPEFEELVGFYDNIYSLAESGDIANDTRSMFQPLSIFHNILKEHPLKTRHGFELMLASTIYLNGLLWELRDSPAELERQMHAFRYAFVENAVDIHASEPVTVWVLITDLKTSRIANHPLTWLTCRILRVASHCDSAFRHRLKDALLKILMADEVTAPYLDWTPEKFREDLKANFCPKTNRLPFATLVAPADIAP